MTAAHEDIYIANTLTATVVLDATVEHVAGRQVGRMQSWRTCRAMLDERYTHTMYSDRDYELIPVVDDLATRRQVSAQVGSTGLTSSVPVMQDISVWRKTAHTREQLGREVEALRLLGPAAVHLLAVEGNELVLERVVPGTTVAELPDDQVTAAVATALTSLWEPVPAGCLLPTVKQECQALQDQAAVGPLPQQVVKAARRELGWLLAHPPEPRVLHGDLHHGNLLWSQERGWVAIDPHGLVGDPGYDVGPLLINPWDGEPASLLSSRLAQLSAVLEMPVQRLAAWGLVRAVLAEAWHVQDTGRPAGGPLRVAQVLAHR